MYIQHSIRFTSYSTHPIASSIYYTMCTYCTEYIQYIYMRSRISTVLRTYSVHTYIPIYSGYMYPMRTTGWLGRVRTHTSNEPSTPFISPFPPSPSLSLSHTIRAWKQGCFLHSLLGQYIYTALRGTYTWYVHTGDSRQILRTYYTYIRTEYSAVGTVHGNPVPRLCTYWRNRPTNW